MVLLWILAASVQSELHERIQEGYWAEEHQHRTDETMYTICISTVEVDCKKRRLSRFFKTEKKLKIPVLIFSSF